jgi:O-antigen/teichoic acid export membrane protein
MGPVGGRLLAAIVSGAWALMRIFREFGFHFNYPLIRASFSFNFYTFVYQFLQWVINYFDRIFMVFFLTLAEIGVYDFAIKCLLIIEFILNGLHNSFYPKVVSTVMNQEVKGSAPEINRYYHGFISVILLLICLSILIFPSAIRLLVDLVATAKPGYTESIKYIPYISIIYIFRAIRLFYAAPYGILKYTKPLSGIYLIVSVVKIGVMWLAIDRFGLFGVIAASIIASIVEIILLKATLRKIFRFQYNASKIWVAPGIIFITIMILEPLFGTSIPGLIHITYLLMCLGLLGWIYRNEIRLIKPLDILR